MNHTKFSAFTVKRHTPTREEVEKSLGKAIDAWDRLIERLVKTVDGVEYGWLYGGSAYGWSCRFHRKHRPLLHLCPRHGDFLVSLAINEETRQLELNSDAPEWISSVLRSAPKYSEGYAVRFVVTDESQVQQLIELVLLKLGTGKPVGTSNSLN